MAKNARVLCSKALVAGKEFEKNMFLLDHTKFSEDDVQTIHMRLSGLKFLVGKITTMVDENLFECEKVLGNQPKLHKVSNSTKGQGTEKSKLSIEEAISVLEDTLKREIGPIGITVGGGLTSASNAVKAHKLLEPIYNKLTNKALEAKCTINGPLELGS